MLAPRVLLILSLLRISKTLTTLGFEDIDICNLADMTMYCNCEPVSRNETSITCFILNHLEPENNLWPAFSLVSKGVVSLTLISRNQLQQLEYLPTSALNSLSELQTIIVQDARLGSLESRSVSNLAHLTKLQLERNEILTLKPYSISHLPKLKKLILSENYLSEILADCLEGITNLQELYLDRNNISRIETCAFCSLHNLKELELWGNELTDLTQGMFRGLRYLTRIDLYKNNLRVISSKVFDAMPRLKEIDLKNNAIEYVSPFAFDGLPQLMSIHLNNNRIKTLHETVFKFPKKLMTIDVSSNQLETLKQDVIENLVNVEDTFFTFRFRDNPLLCSCDFRWVSLYTKKVKNQAFSRELRHTKCSSTEDDEPQPIHLLNLTECDFNAETTTMVSTYAVPTAQSGPSTTEVPKMHGGESDDSLGCRVSVYFGLWYLTIIMVIWNYCKWNL